MTCLFLKNKTLQQRLRLFWLVLIFLLILVFLFFKIVPLGRINYVRNYDSFWRSGKGFIYNFTPIERVEESDKWPKIIGDPVYFSVFTPRTFSEAKLTVSYYSNLGPDTPIIEAGVLADRLVWRYDLKPLKNQILDDLLSQWEYIRSGDLIFLQKNKSYENFSDFLNDLEAGELKNCPQGVISCLATYNFNLNYQVDPKQIFRNDLILKDNNISILDNQKIIKNTASDFSVPLKGNHVLLVYLEEAAWRLRVDLMASSTNTKNNPIRLILTKDQEIVKEVFLEGRDVDWQSQKEKELVLEGNFSSGLYKLEIKVSDDVIIKNINSSSGQLVFAYKFWPVYHDSEIIIFTDSNYLQVKALDPASLQNIIFDNQSFAVTRPYEQFEFKVSGGDVNDIKEIKLEKGDIILENNSVFSLSREDFFNPLVKKIDRNFIKNEDLNYVIANYQAPSASLKDDNLKIASAEFKLKGMYREKGKYNFMLSIPGLKTGNNQADYLAIKEVKIEFKGRSLWQKIFNISD